MGVVFLLRRFCILMTAAVYVYNKNDTECKFHNTLQCSTMQRTRSTSMVINRVYPLPVSGLRVCLGA